MVEFRHTKEWKRKIRENAKINPNYGMKGKHHTEETKRKMSLAHKGKNCYLFGKHRSEETKKKISESHKGKKLSEEHKRKLSRIETGKGNPFYGKHHTKEAKEKMSKVRKGKKLSKQTRIKMSNSHKGMKHRKETIMKMLGENNPAWLGGLSFEPYTSDFNKRLKKQIRERDKRCMLCNISLEDLKLLKRQTAIHHIDYNKENSLSQNLVTLCVNCHPLTNMNRDQWIIFFQKLLAKEYGYEYNEEQKIILDFTKVKL